MGKRIHFGIYKSNFIKWPNRCLFCGGNVDNWLKARKTRFDFKYYLLVQVEAKEQTIRYPVCKKHYNMGHQKFPSLKYPSIYLGCLVPILFLFELALKLNHWLSLIFSSLFVLSAIDFSNNGAIIHRINDDFIEISIPEGKYAEDFGLLNNCNNLTGYYYKDSPTEYRTLLMQSDDGNLKDAPKQQAP